MMKAKKLLASILASAMTISSVPAVNFIPEIISRAVSQDCVVGSSEDRYFYNQLSGKKENETQAYQAFYNAMEQMLNEKKFINGEELDLVEAGYFTPTQVSSYAGGSENVISVYGAARDAFTGDHPEVFYVDFSALTIRIKTIGGKYHMYLGAGRRDTYWTETFTSSEEVQSAVDKYSSAFETAYSTIESNANELADDGVATDADFIRAAHDYITNHTSYRLENKFESTDKAQYLIRTSYGSLVNQKAVCEGYARLFKAFLDRKGINCVLVQGAYRPTPESYELHMWTYVEIDGTWYAVDPTMDDPTNNKKGNDDVGIDGFENHEYLLKGDNKMAVKYAPSGIRSESNYEFAYPTLSYDNYGMEVVYNSNGLIVTLEEGEQQEGEKCGVFKISYKGMGLTAAREAGFYMLFDTYAERGGISSRSYDSGGGKSYDELVSEAGIGDLSWSGYMYMGLNIGVPYFDNDSEASGDFYETPEHLVIKLPQAPYVKFAVTNKEPGKLGGLYGDSFLDSAFTGTLEDLIATTDSIFNSNGMYKAPPYPKNVSPSLTSALLIDDGKREIKATFDQELIIDEGYVKSEGNKVSLRVDLQDMYDIQNKSGFENSSFTNFRLIRTDGTVTDPIACDIKLVDKKASEDNSSVECTVVDDLVRTFDGINPMELSGQKFSGYTFDFTPSTMYADDNLLYEFDVKGIKSDKIEFEYETKDHVTKTASIEGKEPISISYLAAHRCAAYAFQSQGYDWNVFGKPTLMDSLDGFDFSKAELKGDTSDLTVDGKELNDALKDLTHRMVLVATDAREDQVSKMDELMAENENGLGNLGSAAELDKAEYYNINLTLCKAQVVSTGQAVRVTLGFPAGYGPEDKGKTFKVYHFSKDEKGNITGVNEIPCEITEYGLVVWCDSFSPFAIVPIDIEKAEKTLVGEEKTKFEESVNQKTVIFKNTSVGGTVQALSETDTEGLIKVNIDETAKIKITADEGYDIESITISGKAQKVTDNDEITIELPYSEFEKIDEKVSNLVVEADFVSENVFQKDKEANAKPVKPTNEATKFVDGFSTLKFYNAALGGNIMLNFYVEFKEGTDLEGAKAIITDTYGKTTESALGEPCVDLGANVYKVSCEVPAKNINKLVTVKIQLADGTIGSTYEHSVKLYLDALNNNGNYEKEKEVVESLMNYGNAADSFFKGSDVTVSNELKEKMNKITVDTVKSNAAKFDTTNSLPNGIQYKYTSLILESETTLRHYFAITDKENAAQIAKENGLTAASDGLYYKEIANIKAQNLDKEQEVKVGNYTITASPLSYVYAVLKSNSNNNLKNLVKTLYLYNQAANNYLTLNTQ